MLTFGTRYHLSLPLELLRVLPHPGTIQDDPLGVSGGRLPISAFTGLLMEEGGVLDLDFACKKMKSVILGIEVNFL